MLKPASLLTNIAYLHKKYGMIFSVASKKYFSSLTISLILFSFPINAAELGQNSIFHLPRHLFRAAKRVGALVTSVALNRKRVLWDEPLLELPPGRSLGEKENLLVSARVNNFARKEYEYERLQRARKNGQRLSNKELTRLFELDLEHRLLDGQVGFEAPQKTQTPIKDDSNGHQVPGMRMAGCGQSCEASAKPTTKQEPKQDESIDEQQKYINQAIGQSQTGGILDLSRIEFTAEQLGELFTSLPQGIIDGIHTIDLRECQLTGILPSLERFKSLEILKASTNKLTGLEANLPVSLKSLSIHHNSITSAVNVSHLVHLTEIDATHNQLTEFPRGWYERLAQNYASRTSKPKLNLQGNPIESLPDGLSTHVDLVVDNHPNLLTSGSDPSLEGSVTFSNEYPDRILDNLFLGALEHVTPGIVRALGIQHVINCANDPRAKRAANSASPSVSHLDLPDVPADSDEIDLAAEALKIDTAFRDKKVVLVHCYQGRNRSASVVIAYLMLYHGMSREKAIDYVKERRPCIDPKPGYMARLITLNDAPKAPVIQPAKASEETDSLAASGAQLLDSESSDSDEEDLES